MSTALIKPAWSPATIALMVLGFIVFWPLGLAVLGYILWGEKLGGSPEKAQAYWNKGKGWVSSAKGPGAAFNTRSSGNAAFDAYRADQLRKFEEERARLDSEIDAFHEYMANLHQARDREEFDRFMADRNGTRQGYGDDAKPVNPQGANNWGD